MKRKIPIVCFQGLQKFASSAEKENEVSKIPDASQNSVKDIPIISVTEVNEQLALAKNEKTAKPVKSPSVGNRGSVYENVDYIETIPEEETGESDTFNLVRESRIFSQVSDNTLKESDLSTEKHLSLEVGVKSSDPKCRVVEVKEIQIPKTVVASVEPMEHSVMSPGSVEIVEIVDSGAEESDVTDQDEKKSPATVRRNPDQKKKQVTSGEVVAKKQKLADDKDDTVSIVSPMEVANTTQTDVRLKISDRIAHSQKATVTSSQTVRKSSVDKVTLHKEVRVTKTYEVVGNFSKDDTIPMADDDSFYGSDKETDDVVVFSEDEAKIEDDSSSNDEVEPLHKDEEQVGYLLATATFII